MTSVKYQKDQNNIVHLILDKPNSSANLMDSEFTDSLTTAVEQLRDEKYAGVIFRSAKKTFFAGGNLDDLHKVDKGQAQPLYDMVSKMKFAMRELETSGKPVVACINGAALGGGWEIALACHHRIALSNDIKLGLPEVTLGLLPGGGGIVRMTRLLGLQAALPFLTEGKQFTPDKGKELGLINDIVASEEQLVETAIDWIKANPEATQPYDQKGYKVPGGKPSSPAVAKMLPIAPSMIRAQTKGTMPAPESILSVMVEGLQVDVNSALRIETRYFVDLVCSQVAKNMIGTLWFQLNDIKAGASRPDSISRSKVKKVGVLGAGMMGAGIAYSAAKSGISVVLKDISMENAEKGKAYSQTLLDKKLKKNRISQQKRDQVLDLITATDIPQDLEGCDLIIEAVFEGRELKAGVTREAEAYTGSSTIFASNTSTLPITGLASASTRPENFIGLHFFSPVDKMPLVEIICGKKTSTETLAKAYDYVLQTGKTPIVVNDSRGFYTSRVFRTYANEGIEMLGEGIPAAAIENAAYLAGYPVGPLAVTDEVSLTLAEKIRTQTIKDLKEEGVEYEYTIADSVLDKMLEVGRSGKLAGAGFYEYPSSGKKHLWPSLKNVFEEQDSSFSLEEMKSRFLIIQAIETVRCMEEKVLTSIRDANIGSIMGIGFPVWTGGILQYINQTGLSAFIEKAEQLAALYGKRFEVPSLLKEMEKNGHQFEDQ